MRRLFFAILALALAQVASSAQTPRDSWDNVKQLQPGHKIKVVDMSLKSWDGRLVSVSEGAITIRELRNQQEITVERAKVWRVTDLQRSSRGRNAAIGFLAGAIVGATRDTEGNAYRAVLAGLFGGIGVGVGALVPSHPAIYSGQREPAKATAGPPASRPAQ
jgi:hypothetical protein